MAEYMAKLALSGHFVLLLGLGFSAGLLRASDG